MQFQVLFSYIFNLQFTDFDLQFVVVEVDGKIYPCPFLTDEEFCMGSMQKGQMIINRSIDHIVEIGKSIF